MRLEELGGCRVLRLRGSAQERGLALAPWMEVAGALSKREAGAAQEDPAAAELRRMLDRCIDAEEIGGQALHRLARALEAVLARLGESQPSVLLVDDAHLLDSASLWLVGYCLRRAGALKLRALLTWNAEDDGFDTPEALGAALGEGLEVEAVPLPALSSRAIRRIAEAALTPLAGGAPSGVRARIEVLADGNPMVAKEIAWTLLKRAGATGAGVKASGEEGAGLAVPVQVRRHLAGRLDPLRREARRVLEVLSIEAAAMSEAELAEVLPLKPEVLSAALESLSAAGLIRADGGTERRFRSQRAYERWAAAESLTPVRRAALHERMAAMLEQAGVEDEQGFLRLSVHREGAGETASACDAILAAARLARGRGAYREARRHLYKAEQAIAAVRHRTARTALSVEILLEQARLAELAQEDAKVTEHLAAAGEEVELLPSSILYRLLMARARNAAACGQLHESHRQFRHAIMVAERHGRPVRPRAADRLLNQLHLIDCAPEAYARRLEETAKTLNERQQRLAECEVTGALALLHAAGGRFDDAAETMATAMALADSMGDEVLLAAALQWRGTLALWRNDPSSADADLTRAAKIAESRGDLLRLQMAQTLRAKALLAGGDISTGTACLDQARALADRIDDREGRTLAAAAEGEFAIQRGDTAAARRAAEHILGRENTFQRPWNLALGRRLLARVLLDDPAGAPAEAERAARHAVAEQEALGLKVEAARSLLVQARAYRAAGNRREAAETYGEAARRLSAMGLTQEATEAQALAAALSVETVGTVEGPE